MALSLPAPVFAIACTGESLRPLIAVGTIGVAVELLLVSGHSLTRGGRTDAVIAAPIPATFPTWTLLPSHAFIARLERITPQLAMGALLSDGQGDHGGQGWRPVTYASSRGRTLLTRSGALAPLGATGS